MRTHIQPCNQQETRISISMVMHTQRETGRERALRESLCDQADRQTGKAVTRTRLRARYEH